MIRHTDDQILAVLNRVFIGLRSLAYEKAPYSDIAEMADHAEYLPQLVAKPEDCTADFVATLEQMATKYPIFRHALDRLSSNDRWC